MANKIRLTVGGISLSVFSDGNEEYIRAIGRELDTKINRLIKQNPFLSPSMAAVLSAMDATDAAKKCEEQCSRLEVELKEMKEQCAAARSDANRAMIELEELKHKNGKNQA